MKINGLLLAAGSSSRLGQPKQLLPIKGTTLLNHKESIIYAQVSQLFTVIGFDYETMSKELVCSTQVVNPNWNRGMGNSLKSGLNMATKNADALLIALCDQVKIPATHYKQLVEFANQHPERIIASSYNSVIGVPAIFPKVHFNQLHDVGDQQGAQILISELKDQVISIQCANAEYDIDTPKDLELLF